MRYLALGDSISIDEYTGVRGGGAANQFAARIEARGADFQNLTSNGNLTEVVLEELDDVTVEPEVITLTIGGNDLALLQEPTADILPRLAAIGERLAGFGCTVIINTVYDPTDGSDAVGEEAGFRPELRAEYNALNAGIKAIAERHGFLLADLEALFHGHGVESSDPWFVQVIEPNLAGATAIAGEWLRLLEQRGT
jgi:lysophospholipase L1-like esterase